MPIEDVLKNVSNLEDWTDEHHNPIEVFAAAAKSQAAKSIDLDKSNMGSALEEAATYRYCIITVGNHTLVRVGNMEDCQQSGSWGACMPYVKGYIQKGGLEKQEDYMNNIIGTPDNQERVMYLFEG